MCVITPDSAALVIWRAFGAPFCLSKTFASLLTDIACRRVIVQLIGSDSSQERQAY